MNNRNRTVDFAKRREKLWKRANAEGVSALLVTRQINVRYLTGFTGSSGYLLLERKKATLLSDSRYETQIADECDGLDVVIRDASSTQISMVADVCSKSKLASLAFESDDLTHDFYEKLRAALTTELVPTAGWVQELRMIKDRVELELIRQSIRINERAFQVIRAQLAPDQTEREIAHNLEHQIRSFGGEQCSFDPIVAVGPRSALPHADPTYAKVGDAGFMLIDWGAQFEGYASDLTRMIVTAKIPPKIRKIHEIVLKAQLAAIARIRPGAAFQSADKAARNVIRKAGFGKYFGHGLGHGFGLEIHESPFVSPIREGVFRPNMVVTVEPGIYLPGVGGVRIEDNVRVTRDGVEILSSLPKSFDESIIQL